MLKSFLWVKKNSTRTLPEARDSRKATGRQNRNRTITVLSGLRTAKAHVVLCFSTDRQQYIEKKTLSDHPRSTKDTDALSVFHMGLLVPTPAMT